MIIQTDNTSTSHVFNFAHKRAPKLVVRRSTYVTYPASVLTKDPFTLKESSYSVNFRREGARLTSLKPIFTQAFNALVRNLLPYYGLSNTRCCTYGTT